MVAGLDAAASDADFDPTLVQVTAAARVVVALVGVQLVGSTQGTTGSVAMSADAGVGLEQGLELHAVVGVRRRQQRVQDQTTSVDEQVVLRAGLAAVGRVPAGQLAPLFARTETLSTQPRDQSMSSASESSSSTRRCSRSRPRSRPPRVLVRSLVGCIFYGAFTAKMLVLRAEVPRWVLPVLGGAAFTALTAVWLTSAVWFFTTSGFTI